MPNHCSNDLYVIGPLDEVLRFRDNAVTINKEGGATLNEAFIMPYPKHYKELDDVAKAWEQKCQEGWELAKTINPDVKYPDFYKGFSEEHGERPRDGYNMGGYEWCNMYWGTKWGSYNGAELKLTEAGKNSKLKLTFDTAWCTYGEEFMSKLSKLFPTLEIKNRWFEMGMAQQGVNIWKDGVLVESKQKRYTGERGG
jgi:hypothetical protein